MSLQSANIARVQALVGEYMKGNAAGYLEGCSDDFKGSVLGGLIPGGSDIKSKDEFIAVMNSMDKYMEVKSFEPMNWRAVNDDVLFSVDWKFVWMPGTENAKEVETTALVRKVVRDGMICEKYHMCDVESITGDSTPVHDNAPVKRVQELLAEYMKGNAPGYLEGCSDDFKGSVLGGLIPGASDIKSLDEFKAVMGQMDKYMEVKSFEPINFRALPNSDMMFQVQWKFIWKETGVEMDHTAMVRKVINADNQICEKYHMCDVAAITNASPRDVITAGEGEA